jgi:hypothetical protein
MVQNPHLMSQEVMGKSQNAGALKHDLKLPLGCVYNLYMKGK